VTSVSGRQPTPSVAHTLRPGPLDKVQSVLLEYSLLTKQAWQRSLVVCTESTCREQHAIV